MHVVNAFKLGHGHKGRQHRLRCSQGIKAELYDTPSLYLDQFKLVLVTGQPLTVRIVDSAELCGQCLVNNQDSHLTICS